MSSVEQTQKIVHEAIDERQHIRTKIPAKAYLHSKLGKLTRCDVEDISLGGVGLKCAEQLNISGIYNLTIKMMMNHLELRVTSTVKVVKQTDSFVGVQFVNLDVQKSDIIRYIITSYLSGDIADINGLFNVMQRENYIKERKSKQVFKRTFGQRLRAGFGSMVFMLLGIVAFSYVLFTAHKLYFRLPAAHAMISANAYLVNMPDNGNITYLIPEGDAAVSVGQPVATISSQLRASVNSVADLDAIKKMAPRDVDAILRMTSLETVISSPCNCHVYYPNSRVEGYAYKGDTVAHLIPLNSSLHVSASVPYAKFDMLNKTNRVKLTMIGSGRTMNGSVVKATVNQTSKMIDLIIQPDDVLNMGDYQKPVMAEFYRSWFVTRDRVFE